jgi:hypothetical protein
MASFGNHPVEKCLYVVLLVSGRRIEGPLRGPMNFKAAARSAYQFNRSNLDGENWAVVGARLGHQPISNAILPAKSKAKRALSAPGE